MGGNVGINHEAWVCATYGMETALHLALKTSSLCDGGLAICHVLQLSNKQSWLLNFADGKKSLKTLTHFNIKNATPINTHQQRADDRNP